MLHIKFYTSNHMSGLISPLCVCDMEQTMIQTLFPHRERIKCGKKEKEFDFFCV